MTRNDSDWVRDLFTTGTRNWTPPAATSATCVLYAPVSPDPEAAKRCESVLSDTELQRAERFITEDLKTHLKQRRAFRRYCGSLALGSSQPLSQIIFHETEKGRPYLPDLPNLWFSFSSSRYGFLGAWSSTHAIGVDLEDRTRKLEASELAQQFFSEAEAKVVEGASGPRGLETFLKLWSLKEAALKSIGEGLPFGLGAFEFELAPKLSVVRVPLDYGGPERFKAHVIESTDSCAALVIRSQEGARDAT